MTRGRAAAARVAHNHKVAGSSPAPATISTFTSVIFAEVLLFSSVVSSNSNKTSNKDSSSK